MKQLTIKKKITLWYTGIIAVVLGTILVLVLLFVDKVGISATEEEISAAVTGFSSNINFQDDSFYLDGDTEFYDDGIMFCIYDKNGRLLSRRNYPQVEYTANDNRIKSKMDDI